MVQEDRPASTERFILGDGTLACVVEWYRAPGHDAYGLLLAVPGRMARREGTLLWHPEHALRRTMLTIVIDGARHAPGQDSTEVFREDDRVVIRWRAGDAVVEERLRVIVQVLQREVTVLGATGDVRVEAALYGNPLLFDEFSSDGHLEARGLTSIALLGGQPFERFVSATAITQPDGARTWRFEYVSPCGHDALKALRDRHDADRIDGPLSAHDPFVVGPDASRAFPLDAAAGTSPLSRLLAISRSSIRAAVSHDGRFNASLFQYEFEWGLDAAMVASAAALGGDVGLAREILTNLLTRLSNDDGMVAEAGRFRGGELSELNGNGAALDAVWRYWLVTRDDGLVRRHWERIVAIAEYPLRDEFAHESGLLRTRRDFWERFPWQGVGDGFELGHQVFCAVGLDAAASLAAIVGDEASAARWRGAAATIRTAMLSHPTLSLIDGGRFIRRRLVDGRIEDSLIADPTWRRDEYAPYLPPTYDTSPRACEPDVTEVLPILYGLVDPRSEIARATLDAVATLWTPVGGYSRYNVASEPDSPGPWPFASAMVAGAELAAGLDDRAQRTIDWLVEAAGAGGSWLEYYGERESPPLPPVGIIVWGWAQFILLAIESMAGVRIDRDHVRINPRMSGIAHVLRIGERSVRLVIEGLVEASLDGESCSHEVILPLSLSRDHDVHYH